MATCTGGAINVYVSYPTDVFLPPDQALLS